MKNICLLILSAFLISLMTAEEIKADGPYAGGLDLTDDPTYLDKPLSAKEEEVLRLAHEFNNHPIKPVRGRDGQIMYVFGSTVPAIIGSPFMITDIELETGETVNEILVGDSARWLVESGTSGTGIQHVFVKPVDVGLETSLAVTTNKRVYHLQLISRTYGFTPYIGFLYSSQLQPVLKKDAREREWRTALVDGGQPVDMSNLNFRYSVKGSGPWKPVMVYDDGLKMYIRLPESARRSEVPVLLVRQGRENTLVNYRLRYNTFEVDGIFDHVLLVAGVGRKQEKIDIARDLRIAAAAKDEGKK
ncbi:MAG: P-type conjugative transfer protein TrbG [Deltaproteobacteria bacterium]|jgi:type IV secretion system protein VirB9|nr:P-type conjugative transfer protein TrbG [Deltaproteobacteria bacterium]